MKLHQVVAVLSFIAAGASATPEGYGEKNKDVKYGNNYGNNYGNKYGNDYGNKYGNNYGDKYGHDKDGKDGKDKYGNGKDRHDKDRHDKDGKDGKDKYGNGKDRHDKDRHDKDGKDGKDRYGHGKDGYGKDHDKDGKDGKDRYGHGKDGYGKDHDKDGKDGHGYGHGKDKCKTYEWDIGRCNWCPYKPYHPRDLDGLEARGDYGYGKTCKKTCPDKKKKCKKQSWDYSKPTYAGSFEKSSKCEGRDSYKVKGEIAPCGDWGKYGSKQCLFVEYDWDKWSDKKAYLGIYTTETEGPKYKEKLNLTKRYCKRNKCVVPLNKFPGWPKLCGKSVWVGIDIDQCKPKKGHGYGGYGKDKYGKDKYGKDKDGENKYGHDDDKHGKDKDGKNKYGHDDNEYGNGNKDKRDNEDKYGNNNNYGNDNYGDKDGNNYGNDNYGDKDGNKYGNNYGDNDDNYGTDRYGNHGRNHVKYVKLDITCTYPKKCAAWCCCA